MRKIATDQQNMEYDICRFWGFVEKSEGCWIWKGPMSDDGYGRISLRSTRRRLRANRACWLLTHGNLPEDLMVCHTCDNPPCVNPDHLFLGTALDNNSDCSRKGRARVETKVHKGAENGRSKLTDDQVREIRRRYIPQVVSLPTLGKEYGVSAQVIHSIVTGKRWTHVV